MSKLIPISIALLVFAGCATLASAKESTFYQEPEVAVAEIAVTQIAVAPLSAEQLAGSIKKATVEVIAVSELPPPVPTFTLATGKTVGEQFREFGKKAGWNLIWQAPDYVVDQSNTLQGDFEVVITSFLKSVNESGSQLRASFYRGNKTVRIEEF